MTTQTTSKEPVRLRRRTVSGGRQSLYLDIYIDGHRSYEYLKLYLIPERNGEDRRKNIQTLQYMLYKYIQEAQQIAKEIKEKNPEAKVELTPRGVRMTVTMLTVIPVLFIYPFFQRFLIKGLLIGAVKG